MAQCRINAAASGASPKETSDKGKDERRTNWRWARQKWVVACARNKLWRGGEHNVRDGERGKTRWIYIYI